MKNTLLALIVPFLLSSSSFGAADPYAVGNRLHPSQFGESETFLKTVQPLLGQRCVACHGCTDSPCQLKLGDYDELRRGGHLELAYSRSRIGRMDAGATRMSDAGSLKAWRDKGFFPVVTDAPGDNKQANLDASIFYAFIRQGRQNLASGLEVDAEDSVDRSLFSTEDAAVTQLRQDVYKDYKFQCKATLQETQTFLKSHPLMRMPLGLPQLKKAQFQVLENYVAAGTPAPSAAAMKALKTPAQPPIIDAWHAFLNGKTPKEQLVARYLFEHMYSHRLHFSQMPGEFYRVFRSSAACRAPKEIRTELVTDEPGAERVYYCLEKHTGLITQKNHVPWEITEHTMGRYKKMFFESTPKWDLSALPGYTSSNQFIYFEAIPSSARYVFLLENARAIVDALVRGDVCKGQGATYAISDLFWVFFLKPESDVTARTEGDRITKLTWQNLGAKPQFGPLEVDLKLVEKNALGNKEYLAAVEFQTRRMLKDRQLETVKGKAARALARTKQLSTGLSISRDVWDGTKFSGEAGRDPNAMIQVTRHGRSATVQFGREGGRPQAVWVMNYANLERLYYNLVVQFKYWENLAHKFGTWRHMSYVRREGEDLFLSFLPPGDRRTVRSHYTKGLKGFAEAENLIRFPDHSLLPMLVTRLGKARPTGEKNFTAGTSLGRAEELVRRFLARANPTQKDALNTPSEGVDLASLDSVADVKRGLGNLAENEPGSFQRWLPDTSFVRVIDGSERHHFTVLGNRAYDIGDVVFLQGLARRPDEDTHSVYAGLIGNFPNMVFDVPLRADEKGKSASDFVKRLGTLSSVADWIALKNLYGIARTTNYFWTVYDQINQWNVNADPIGSGIKDLVEYDVFDEHP